MSRNSVVSTSPDTGSPVEVQATTTATSAGKPFMSVLMTPAVLPTWKSYRMRKPLVVGFVERAIAWFAERDIEVE